MTRFAAIRTMIVLAAATALAACGINSVPTKEEAAKAAWADVQSSYQRRADLVPNLVASVRGAAQSETTILTNVTNARAAATSINITTDDLSNPAEFKKFQDAQNQLTQALGQLRTVVENYPQLQSQARFADLMTALEGSENRTVPSAIGAKIIHGAKPMVPFEAAAGSDVAPTVDFGTTGAQPGAAPGAAPAVNDNATATPAATATAAAQ